MPNDLIMDLSIYAPKSFSDPKWIDQYIAKMGESEFWLYKSKVYNLLDSMEVGFTLPVTAWAEVWNYDLFIKIACFYISESDCCYSINQSHTIIKRNFDAREMEKTLTLLKEERGYKIPARDGRGTERKKRGSKTISAPEPAIQSKPR